MKRTLENILNILEKKGFDDAQITNALIGISATVMQAAAAEVDAQYGDRLTPIERTAAIATTAFRKAGALDLASVYLRAQLLLYIQQNRLLSVHPAAQYESLADMASQNGCSVTEMSAILDFVNVLFPYLENDLHLSVPDVWARLGKSKLKEMLPVLKSLITGESSDTKSTRNVVSALLDNEFVSMRANHQYAEDFEIIDNQNNEPGEIAEAEARLRAAAIPAIIDHLIDVGGELPVIELRRTLRPETVQEAEVLVVRRDERCFIAAELDNISFEKLIKYFLPKSKIIFKSDFASLLDDLKSITEAT